MPRDRIVVATRIAYAVLGGLLVVLVASGAWLTFNTAVVAEAVGFGVGRRPRGENRIYPTAVVEIHWAA